MIFTIQSSLFSSLMLLLFERTINTLLWVPLAVNKLPKIPNQGIFEPKKSIVEQRKVKKLEFLEQSRNIKKMNRSVRSQTFHRRDKSLRKWVSSLSSTFDFYFLENWRPPMPCNSLFLTSRVTITAVLFMIIAVTIRILDKSWTRRLWIWVNSWPI